MSRLLLLILFFVGSAVPLLGCQATPTVEPVTINGISVPPEPPLPLNWSIKEKLYTYNTAQVVMGVTWRVLQIGNSLCLTALFHHHLRTVLVIPGTIQIPCS